MSTGGMLLSYIILEQIISLILSMVLTDKMLKRGGEDIYTMSTGLRPGGRLYRKLFLKTPNGETNSHKSKKDRQYNATKERTNDD